jgi:hypothetical protein
MRAEYFFIAAIICFALAWTLGQPAKPLATIPYHVTEYEV